MPTAPMNPNQSLLSPADTTGQKASNAGINPANFLIAAAEMQGQGQLQMKSSGGPDPIGSGRGGRTPRRPMKVIK